MSESSLFAGALSAADRLNRTIRAPKPIVAKAPPLIPREWDNDLFRDLGSKAEIGEPDRERLLSRAHSYNHGTNLPSLPMEGSPVRTFWTAFFDYEQAKFGRSFDQVCDRYRLNAENLAGYCDEMPQVEQALGRLADRIERDRQTAEERAAAILELQDKRQDLAQRLEHAKVNLDAAQSNSASLEDYLGRIDAGIASELWPADGRTYHAGAHWLGKLVELYGARSALREAKKESASRIKEVESAIADLEQQLTQAKAQLSKAVAALNR